MDMDVDGKYFGDCKISVDGGLLTIDHCKISSNPTVFSTHLSLEQVFAIDSSDHDGMEDEEQANSQPMITINHTIITHRHPDIKAKIGKITLYPQRRHDQAQLYSLIYPKLHCIKNRGKRIMVVMNPKSGQGKAPRLYKDLVRPMLHSAGIHTDLFPTQHVNHAKLLAHEYDANVYDGGIVLIGGDGLLHECINGLFARADWWNAVHTPIGIITAGTSNAVGKSLGLIDPTYSLSQIIRGRTVKGDAMLYEYAGRRFYGHLAFMWGLFADIDLMADSYRFMGRNRLIVSTLARIWQMQSYEAEIVMLKPSPTNQHAPSQQHEDKDGNTHEDDEPSQIAANGHRPTKYKRLFEHPTPHTHIKLPTTRYYSFLAILHNWLDEKLKISNKMVPGYMNLFLVATKRDENREEGGGSRRCLGRTTIVKALIKSEAAQIHDDPEVCQHYYTRAFAIRFPPSAPSQDNASGAQKTAILDVDGEEVSFNTQQSNQIYVEMMPQTLRFYAPNTEREQSCCSSFPHKS